MKRNIILAFAAVVICTAFSTVVKLTDEERAKAKDHLTATKDAVIKSVASLSDAQLKFKPNPEAWSIAECVEHIAISEDNIMGLVQKTLSEDPDPAKKALLKSDEEAVKWISTRTMKVKTSENFVPSGKFGSFEETLKAFVTKREATLRFIETTNEDLRGHYFTFPADVLGTMDAYQIVLFMSGHTKRHTLQIEELKSHPDFPKH